MTDLCRSHFAVFLKALSSGNLSDSGARPILAKKIVSRPKQRAEGYEVKPDGVVSPKPYRRQGLTFARVPSSRDTPCRRIFSINKYSAPRTIRPSMMTIFPLLCSASNILGSLFSMKSSPPGSKPDNEIPSKAIHITDFALYSDLRSFRHRVLTLFLMS